MDEENTCNKPGRHRAPIYASAVWSSQVEKPVAAQQENPGTEVALRRCIHWKSLAERGAGNIVIEASACEYRSSRGAALGRASGSENEGRFEARARRAWRLINRCSARPVACVGVVWRVWAEGLPARRLPLHTPACTGLFFASRRPDAVHLQIPNAFSSPTLGGIDSQRRKCCPRSFGDTVGIALNVTRAGDAVVSTNRRNEFM